MNRNTQVLERLAAANPVPDTRALAPTDIAADSMLTRIRATSPAASATRRSIGGKDRLSLRAAAVVAAVLGAVFVPALAVATHYGLFDFTNQGQPIDRTQISLSELSALEQSGFGNEIRRLGERAGVAFYVAPSRSGGRCFSTGSASGPTPKLNYFVGCQRSSADAFPSAKEPILDLSPMKTPNPREVVYVQRLVGFAADGVARVGFVDIGGTVHSTPVVDNIYATDWSTTDVPATAIIALDKEGGVLYRRALCCLRQSGNTND